MLPTWYIDKIVSNEEGIDTYHLIYKTWSARKAFNYWFHRLYGKGLYTFGYNGGDHIDFCCHIGSCHIT